MKVKVVISLIPGREDSEFIMESGFESKVFEMDVGDAIEPEEKAVEMFHDEIPIRNLEDYEITIES